ncbi:MAG: hypothetical protein AVDCRST_MAG67-1221 [uncultured Solirubrobacteraceae bacterium]|uniref:Uncharacterized protein n=1 Tax=uncultured Solirubrobacteraceae bacterium TaxID=1162706 RepID=A0A6J4S8C3_9ACTN|nr:MAG: hypothetical protein AVDCRST_MAG67-1221 [uncultured Solirubrobacteraceae bacterium]
MVQRIALCAAHDEGAPEEETGRQQAEQTRASRRPCPPRSPKISEGIFHHDIGPRQGPRQEDLGACADRSAEPGEQLHRHRALLLGLVDDNEATAARILLGCDPDAATIRDAVLDMLSP